MEDGTPPRRGHLELLRSLALADLITLANAGAGMAAILLAVSYVGERDGRLMGASLAMFPLALLCDALDGMVARWRRRSSPLGADLDSLADIVSFGVAPAVVGFALGADGGWDALILIYFVSCGVARLARYNATAEALADERGKVRYYEGAPIPTSVLVVAALGVAFLRGEVHERLWLGALQLGPWLLHPLTLVYALSGTAMVSATLRIPKP